MESIYRYMRMETMNLSHKKAILSHILGGPTLPVEESKRIIAPNAPRRVKDAPTVKVELTDAKQERLIELGYYGELARKRLLLAKGKK